MACCFVEAEKARPTFRPTGPSGVIENQRVVESESDPERFELPEFPELLEE